MSQAQRPRLSVSTWSLHRTLGRPPFNGPGDDAVEFRTADDALPLLNLPVQLANFRLHTLEICHFHLPSRQPDYLARLRRALDAAGIELFSLLIDGGDISNPQTAERDLVWIEGWLDTAAQLGATNARVSAGSAEPTPANLERSRAGLQRLAAHAQARNVRLMTENWQALLANAAAVEALLEPLGASVGLCADFGNWTGPSKYDELAAILPRAESCHAKCTFYAQTELDRDDYQRCLRLAQSAGFSGPYTLIYDGPGDDEWLGLDLERKIVAPYLAA